MENYTFGQTRKIYTLQLSNPCVINALQEWNIQKIENTDTKPFTEIHNCQFSTHGLIFYHEKDYIWFILQFS